MELVSRQLENRKSLSTQGEAFSIEVDFYFLMLEPLTINVPFRMTVFGERDGS